MPQGVGCLCEPLSLPGSPRSLSPASSHLPGAAASWDHLPGMNFNTGCTEPTGTLEMFLPKRDPGSSLTCCPDNRLTPTGMQRTKA